MIQRKRSRRDKNQIEIIKAIRALGVTVWETHALGQGSPDIVCGYDRKNFLFEIKDARGKMNRRELLWHAEWRGHVWVVRSWQDAAHEMGIPIVQEC